MKNRKMVFGTILLLFVLTGICSIQNVVADSWTDVEISHSSYVYVGTYTLEYKDELNLYVSSSGDINVYIMDANQFSILQDSLGTVWEYHMRWKDITYLDYTFIIQQDGAYYVVLYNKNLIYKRIVDFSINIDYYYEPIDPVDPIDTPTENYLWNLLLFIVIPIVAIILVIVVPIIIIKRHKKKTPKEIVIIQEKEIPIKIYCSECGTEILDKTRKFCSKCGTEIIN